MLLKGTGNPGNVRRVGTNGCEGGKVCVGQRTEEDSSFERRTNVAEGVHDGDSGGKRSLRLLHPRAHFPTHDVIHPPRSYYFRTLHIISKVIIQNGC